MRVATPLAGVKFVTRGAEITGTVVARAERG
jgi:hypothetical protein